MEWTGHALLGLRAAEGLPEWEINLLKTTDMSDESIRRAFMPEIRNIREKLGAYCLILDWVYQEEFAHYARLDNGKWVPHAPVSSNFTAEGCGKNLSFSANVKLLSDLLERLIESLKKGDMDEAICRFGAIGHFVQEPFTPGHSFDNKLFQELFPDPDPGRNLKLHWAFDCASGDYPPPKPRLLGKTIPEAANNLFSEMYKGMKHGYRYIAPVISSVYRGDPPEVRKAILAGQSEWAAIVTASAWHTAFCIAFDKFNQEELNALDSTDLTSIPPYDYHLNTLDNLISGCITGPDGKKQPMTVFTDDGEQTFSKGFSLYGHGSVKFYLNSVYSKFRCYLGMPSRMLRGQDEHARLDFSIETDDVENTVYSEDICYNGTRIYSAELSAGMKLQKIEVDISGAKCLIISSRAVPWINEQGIATFSVPDLVIAEPELIK